MFKEMFKRKRLECVKPKIQRLLRVNMKYGKSDGFKISKTFLKTHI